MANRVSVTARPSVRSVSSSASSRRGVRGSRQHLVRQRKMGSAADMFDEALDLPSACVDPLKCLDLIDGAWLSALKPMCCDDDTHRRNGRITVNTYKAVPPQSYVPHSVQQRSWTRRSLRNEKYVLADNKPLLLGDF